MIRRPPIHADLAALAALAATDQDAAGHGVQVTFDESERLAVRRPARHNKTTSVLVRKTYGHPDEKLAIERVLAAFEDIQGVVIPLRETA